MKSVFSDKKFFDFQKKLTQQSQQTVDIQGIVVLFVCIKFSFQTARFFGCLADKMVIETKRKNRILEVLQ